MKNKKASVTIYFALIVSMVIIVLMAAIFAPMGVLFNAEAYAAGESILVDANDSLQNISDPTIKAQLTGAVDSALAAGQTNVEVNADMFQYSWIFVIILVGVIVFLYSRRLNELQTGGFV